MARWRRLTLTPTPTPSPNPNPNPNQMAQLSSSAVREALRAGVVAEAEGEGGDASSSAALPALPACLRDFVQAEGLYRD